MLKIRSIDLPRSWAQMLALGASALLVHCADRYQSCTETRTCSSTGQDASGGSAGVGGSAQDAAAGTAGSGGSGGTSGTGTGGGGNDAGAGTSGTGGTTGGTGGTTSDSGAPVDTTPPTVVSVTPADGARGVTKDATITVVFSERMAPALTEAAYASTDLPPTGVDFAWSADGTTLTIDPRSNLAYANDTVPSTTPAKSYAFSIAATAADAAGNALGTPVDARFSTLRRVASFIPGKGWSIEQESGGVTTVTVCDGSMVIGALASSWMAGLAEYDLSVLPADLHSFENARLEAEHIDASANPYGTDNLGSIAADHTSFSPVTSATSDGTALRRIGILSSTPEDGPRSLNVLADVQDDYAKRLDRAYRSQYRFAFTNKNPALLSSLTFTIIDCTSGKLKLSLVYLAP